MISEVEGVWLGTVIAIQANYYSIQLDEVSALAEFVGERTGGLSDQPVILLCIRRGLLKKLGQQIMVGDRVAVEEPDWQGCAVPSRRSIHERIL